MKAILSQTAHPLAALRRSWSIFVLFSAIFLAAGFILLSKLWQFQAGLRWLTLASLTVIYLSIVLWRNLDQNRRPGEEILLPGLGWGNWMSLLRGILTAAVLGFLFSPRPTGWLAWLPAVLYSLAVLADALDGYLARRARHVTRLGGILDLSFDGVGVLAAALLLVQYGQVPAWYILVALARYLFLGGEWVLRRLGRPVLPLPPSIQRRMFASVQFVFIAAALYPVFGPPLTWVAALFFAVPFLVGFGRDFLLVSGALRPAAVAYNRRTLRRADSPMNFSRMLALIQVGLRLGLAFLALISVWQQSRSGLLVGWQAASLALLQLLAALLVLLGVAGRISAGVALALIGLSQGFYPASLVQIAQIAGYTGIIYLGSGPFAAWSPEEAWYITPIGTPSRRAERRSQHETLAQAR